MKKLLYIGNYGNRNIGDDAILMILSKRYENLYKGFQQYVFVRHYGKDVVGISSAKPLRLKLENIFEVLFSFQVIVIGGGGIFSAYTGPLSHFIPLFVILNKVLGKKIIYESIGFYSTTRSLDKLLVRISMLLADSISVRDEESLETVKPVDKIKEILLVQDPGFSIKPASGQIVDKILSKEGIHNLNKKIIGMSVKKVKDDYVSVRINKIMTSVINSLNDKGYAVLMIPFCRDDIQPTEKDLEFSEQILNSVDKKNYILNNYYTPDQIAGVMKKCSSIIGMRYHSMIFAHALKIHLIPISYEEKCDAFIKKYNYPLIRAEGLTGNAVLKHYD